MKTLDNNTDKRSYLPPVVEIIKLDNEISLQLESPTADPYEVNNMSSPDYFNNDPYKTNFG